MITKTEFFNKIVFDNKYSYKALGQILSKGTNQIGEVFKDLKVGSEPGNKFTDKTSGKGKAPFLVWGVDVKKAINEGKFDSLLKTNQTPPRPTQDISPNF